MTRASSSACAPGTSRDSLNTWRSKAVKRALFYIVISIAVAVIGGFMVLVLVSPRLNWGAASKPGALETRIARYVIGGWVRHNSQGLTNPLSETAKNIKAAKQEFNGHCSVCHGLDGSGTNRIEADFNPPVPKLTGSIQSWTDAEIYFVVAHGIRLSAMPGFTAKHTPEDIWKTVLWIRHLPKITTTERTELEKEMKQQTEEHEQMMEKMPGHIMKDPETGADTRHQSPDNP